MRHRFRLVVPLLAAVLTTALTAALTGCAPDPERGVVTIVHPWSGTEPGQEGYAFRQVLEAFRAETGIRYNEQVTRGVSQLVLANLAAGEPPELAVMTSAGELAAHARSGRLRPLDGLVPRDRFRSWWALPIRNGGAEHIYAVPFKVNLKGLIWYNRHAGPERVPRTWAELERYATASGDGPATWCMGMGDGPNTGWPGTDVIEDLILHEHGPDTYLAWAGGRLSWRSEQVRKAWERLGRVWGDHAYGGREVTLLTDFGDAGAPMFASPQGCRLEHQASFMLSFYQRYQNPSGGAARPGADYDFFPFPSFPGRSFPTPRKASIDLIAMFHDTPEARRLAEFLATDRAQRIWLEHTGGDAFMANRDADRGVTRNPVGRNIDRHIDEAEVLCLDAADIMPATMREAFQRGVLEYLANPDRLPDILEDLDEVRRGIPEDQWLSLSCGR